ncbi:cytochrome bc1 complex cytochrome b subunit [Phytoactinopolyspora halotolerans]|uniref:Cytochrome bc1 complex cytochrome b subunit n=1 Tax=Phytoactinopolyspora halotolerans TaxID=1981512 RepID=A0A6L9SA94_9ACTN|nr:ubiquinol-cytochrome c reductase cytochrome b subunit [Phytoactinopolyspora halotolerans]NEE02029.1 ubiquinol-cytochrome c reductase cytochrome b subunit [Phytoactinopolyspora halotolerans]
MIGRRVVRFADERLRLAQIVRKGMAKVFPDHWSFMLGEIALYSFLVLVLTGVYLSLFFEPSTGERLYTGSFEPLNGEMLSAAFASTVELSWDVRGGLLMRQAHHWAALIFVAAIVAHLSRIFFTGAFRKPRDINWVVGTTLLLLAVFNGFAGYSLPDDLLSGSGLRIASAIVLSVPVIGSWMQFVLFGGEFPGNDVIERLYAAHILLVPGAIALLIGVHLTILIRQKHSQFRGPGRGERNVVGSRMWPDYAFRSIALLCAVAAVVFGLGGFAQINPVWLWGPFEPSHVTTPAQPDWYVGWVEGALRLFPPVEFTVFGHLVPAPFIPGVLIPAVTFLVIYCWPWLERRFTKDAVHHHQLDRPREHPFRIAVGVWALWFYGLLLIAAADDIIAAELRIPVFDLVRLLQVAVLILPLLAAFIAYVLARALRAHPEHRLTTMRWQHLGAGLPRRRRRHASASVRRSTE